MSRKKDIVICLGAGKNQIPVINSLRKKGYMVLGVDKDINAPGKIFFDVFINISTYQSDDILKKLEYYENEYNFIGLIARTSGQALFTAAEIIKKYKLKGISKELAELSTIKSNLRAFCQEENIRFADGLLIENNEFNSHALTFPVIVKPDFPVVGKKDVRIIDGPENLNDSIEKAMKSSYNNRVEIENYIEGFDVAYLFYIKKGSPYIITCWDEYVGVKHNNEIIGLGASIPSVVNNTGTAAEIQIIIKKIADRFTEVEAFLILSLRITKEQKAYVIELHSDLGGDLIADVLMAESNRNFNYFDFIIESLLQNKTVDKEYVFSPTSMIYSEPVKIFKNNSLKELFTLSLNEIKSKIDLKNYPLHYMAFLNTGDEL